MENDTQKIIEDQLKKMPKNVKEAIISVDYKVKLQEITKRQRLLIDQAGKLEMETTLVMIGLEPLGDYVTNLQRELDIPTIRAKEISLDVSENIFKPIRESLYKMNEEAETEEGMENSYEKEVTNTEEPHADLNRDQILNEIEDPSLIKESKPLVSNKIAINSTSREIETLDEVPYQQDIKIKTEEKIVVNPETENAAPKSGLLETKMAGMTITSQQVVDAVPEIKLPPIEKKRPSSGIDPYREEIK